MSDREQREAERRAQAHDDPAEAERLALLRCRAGECCAHRLDLLDVGEWELDVLRRFVGLLCGASDKLSHLIQDPAFGSFALDATAVPEATRALGLKLKRLLDLPGCDGCGYHGHHPDGSAAHYHWCPRAGGLSAPDAISQDPPGGMDYKTTAPMSLTNFAERLRNVRCSECGCGIVNGLQGHYSHCSRKQP